MMMMMMRMMIMMMMMMMMMMMTTTFEMKVEETSIATCEEPMCGEVQDVISQKSSKFCFIHLVF